MTVDLLQAKWIGSVVGALLLSAVDWFASQVLDEESFIQSEEAIPDAAKAGSVGYWMRSTCR